MQEGQYCSGTYELLSSVGGVVARRVRIEIISPHPTALGTLGTVRTMSASAEVREHFR
jgi:hypothetical protein